MLFSIVVVLVKVPTNRVGSFFSTPSPAFIVVVQSLSHVWHFATPWTVACRFLCPSLSPRVFSDLCPLSRWCYPTISSSVIPFSSYPQSFPASGSFQMNQLFASSGQSFGVWLPSKWAKNWESETEGQCLHFALSVTEDSCSNLLTVYC